MKDFLFGFMVCLCLGLLTALTQTRNVYKEEADINAEFKNLILNVQGKQFSVRTSTPLVSDLEQGEMVIVNSGGVVNLITRVGNNINNLTRN